MTSSLSSPVHASQQLRAVIVIGDTPLAFGACALELLGESKAQETRCALTYRLPDKSAAADSNAVLTLTRVLPAAATDERKTTKPTPDAPAAASSGACTIGHNALCPCAQLKKEASLPKLATAGKVVKIAACLLLTTPEGVLVTRRSATMRSFPCAWVLPGGAVDPGETLEQTAVRETQEETGLVVSEKALTLLYAWESLYPTQLRYGLPLAQHIIVFFAASLDSPQAKLLKLNPAELDTALFLSPELLATVVAATEPTTSAAALSAAENVPGKPGNVPPVSSGMPAKPEPRIPALRPTADRGLEALQHPQAGLTGIYPNAMKEGIGEGHYFAMKAYLRTRQQQKQNKQAASS